MALNVFVVRGQQNCQSAITARLSDARYNTSVAVYSQELVKQRQLILINRMQSQLNEQATENVNLQSQLLNQTAVDANLKTQLTNLTAERDKKNAIIANLQSQLANQTAIITNLTAEQDKKNVIISNLTAERDRMKNNTNNVVYPVSSSICPSMPLLYDVRRTPTPKTDQWLVIAYTSSVVNIGNYMGITNGRFTAPVDGTYYFAWQGPNGEDIKQQIYPQPFSYVVTNDLWQRSANEFWQYAWNEDTLNKTDIVKQLKRGDTFGLKFWTGDVVANTQLPIQYQRAIALLMTCDPTVAEARAAADSLKLN